jgi:hypothetical protein
MTELVLSQREKIDTLQRTFGKESVYQIHPDYDQGRGVSLSPYAHSYAYQCLGRFYVDLGSIARGDDTYGQTSTVDRSNYRSLMRDYPDTFTPVSYSNTDSLGAYISDLTGDLVAILTGLQEQYPVYDESDMSELESDEITDAWDQYLDRDFRDVLESVLSESGMDRWDAQTAHWQRDTFYGIMAELQYYPEHSGYEIIWNNGSLKGIADRIARLPEISDYANGGSES